MMFRLGKATKVLLIANLAMFLIQQTWDQFFGGHLLLLLGLVPSSFVIDHYFWQIFTYAFLHGDVTHLFLNLLMLAFIAGELEQAWGTRKFLRFYFFCSTLAGALYISLQTFLWGEQGIHTPMVGASGAIYGLLTAYGLLFGERVLLFMMLFPMKAKHFIWVLAGIEFMTSVFSGRNGLASAAHLSGMLAGFLYLWVPAAIRVNRRLSEMRKQEQHRRKKHSNSALKLVVNNPQNKNPPNLEEPDSKDPRTWH